MMFTKKSQASPTITEKAIAERAYKLWQSRGCPEGNGSDDWQAAEAELCSETKQSHRPLSRIFARLRNRAAL